MSSILKALKKLEEEKNLQDEQKEINVSREILKQTSGNRKIIRWLWLLASSAAIVIIILTVALLRKPSPNETGQAGKLPAAAGQPALPALPVEKLPAAPQASGSVTGIRPPSALPINEPKLQPARQPLAQPVEAPRQPVAVQPLAAPAPLAASPKAEPVVKAAARPAGGSEQPLTLSGIAWNKDSADRLAIINGHPIATGATINGALVEEILQDRVKLSRNGLTFELLIGRDARTD